MKPLIPLIGLLALLFVRIQSVYACTSGYPFLINNLDNAEFLVYATVRAVDDRGYNAILEVDRYFKGQSDEYLSIIRWPPALETGAGFRRYDTTCLYAGGGRTWRLGSEGYFGLMGNDNGTYTDNLNEYGTGFQRLYGGAPHFFVENGQIEYVEDIDAKGHWLTNTVSANEFESLLLRLGELASPTKPKSTPSAYPLMRFLNISTQSGQRYQLNPDRSITRLDPQDDPIAISPDGSHVAFQLDVGQVGFQYIWTNPLPENPTGGQWIGRMHPQVGQAVLFSPDSDFVALWNDAKLTLFMFDNYARAGYGQQMNMQTIGQTDLTWTDVDNLPHVVWSADSTVIAYNDEQGIWWWNIFENVEPELVLAANELMPGALIDLSRSGRYIRFGSKTLWTLFDVQSQTTYENTIATPDERNLILIRETFSGDTLDVNRLGEDAGQEARECQAPLTNVCPIYIQYPNQFGSKRFVKPGNLTDIFWYKNNQLAVLECDDERCYLSSYNWRLAISNMGAFRDRILDFPIPPIRAFAYDEWYDQPVIVTDEYVLEFDFYTIWDHQDRLNELDRLDLTKQLDSPIVSIEWGQPIFYERWMN